MDSLADKQVGWDLGWLVDILSREQIASVKVPRHESMWYVCGEGRTCGF